MGTYDGQMHDQYAAGGVSAATLTSGSGGFSAPPPVRLSLGAGAQLPRLTLELDGSFDFPTTLLGTQLHVTSTALGGTAASGSYDATYSVPSRAIANVAAGAEYFVVPDFSVVGGVSTNLSLQGPLSPSQTLGNMAQSRMSSVSLSFGIGSYGGAGDLLIGAQLGYGWGQAVAVNPYVLPNDWAVVDTQTYSAMLIFAGATNLRALGRAVERVQDVVTHGKPDAPPAGPSATPGLPPPK
jgi:hypothetical protein